MVKISDLAEKHPDVILGVAMFFMFMTIDVYAEIHAWHKGIKQIKISEAVGG